MGYVGLFGSVALIRLRIFKEASDLLYSVSRYLRPVNILVKIHLFFDFLVNSNTYDNHYITIIGGCVIKV